MEGWNNGPVGGVLGGLGPLATAQFLRTVVECTDADRDGDHIDLIVTQHSSTPDRTAYLLDQSEPNPGPVLARDAQMLQSMGADFLVIPCNTAHAFVGQVRNAVDVDVLDILEATVDEVTAQSGAPAKVGLLATDGAREVGLYQTALNDAGHEVILPGDADQQRIMHVIYDEVKAGKPGTSNDLAEVIESLRRAGAEYLVLGCTELPIAAAMDGLLDDRTLISSVEALAEATVRRAGRKSR